MEKSGLEDRASCFPNLTAPAAALLVELIKTCSKLTLAREKEKGKSVSQSGRQAGRQAVRQAGRQAGRQAATRFTELEKMR